MQRVLMGSPWVALLPLLRAGRTGGLPGPSSKTSVCGLLLIPPREAESGEARVMAIRRRALGRVPEPQQLGKQTAVRRLMLQICNQIAGHY